MRIIQGVDAGLGRQVKFEVGQQFEQWLEDEENVELWGNWNLKASEKRILLTNFVGAVWENISLFVLHTS